MASGNQAQQRDRDQRQPTADAPTRASATDEAADDGPAWDYAITIEDCRVEFNYGDSQAAVRVVQLSEGAAKETELGSYRYPDARLIAGNPEPTAHQALARAKEGQKAETTAS